MSGLYEDDILAWSKAPTGAATLPETCPVTLDELLADD